MPRSGVQLCYPFEESRLEKWRPPYIIQPKLDGERCRAIWIKGEYVLLSSEENIFVSVPHINAALTELAFNNPILNQPGYSPPEFDGELYRHGWSFEEIHSVVSRTSNLHPHYQMMQYHIFDVVNAQPQCERQVTQVKIAKAGLPDALKLVPFRIVNSLEEVFEFYRECIDNGYEGIIVRNFEATYLRRRSTFVMKFKPKKEDEYGILDLLEAVDKNGVPKNMLGAILCAGDDGTPFKAGAGQLTHEQRVRYWRERELWKGKTIRVGYQNITETGGVPRFGICIELIDRDFQKPTEEFFNPLL